MNRSAFSLVELSVSILIVSLLMLGLMSSIQIVTQASQLVDGPVQETTSLARAVEQMSADLRVAQTFIERSSDAVEFTVADRDGDGNAERIRYQWAAAGDHSLTRTLSYSAGSRPDETSVTAEGLQNLSLRYLTATHGPQLEDPEIESDEVLLLSHDDRPPQAPLRVLMVVANPSALRATDAGKANLLEQWGFAVEPIAASASQSALDNAVGRSDVVFISESTNSKTLGRKLTMAPLGIVCEESHLCDELGFTADVGRGTSQTYLDSTVGTHYLTEGWLPGDAVQIARAQQSVRNLTGDSDRWSSDLKVLALRDGQPALCVLETGDRLMPPPEASAVTAGETSTLPYRTSTSDIKDDCVAMKITLDTHASVTSITANLRLPFAGWTQFALYADSGGEPDRLLAQTERVVRLWGSDGWLTATFDDDVLLPPGDYWLAIAVPDGVRVRYDISGGTARLSAVDPGSGFPAPWRETFGPDPNHGRASVYLTYDAVQSAPARRVMLPWGSSGFDITALNSQGQQLLWRALLWAADATPSDTEAEWGVRSDRSVGQYLVPKLPANATGWRLTRLFCRVKRPELPSLFEVQFKLLSASLDGRPSAYELQSAAATFGNQYSATRYQWFEIPFAGSGDLRVDRGVCLTVEAGGGSDAVLICYDDGREGEAAGAGMLQSPGQGAVWSASTDADLRFYLYGRYRTRGEPQW